MTDRQEKFSALNEAIFIRMRGEDLGILRALRVNRHTDEYRERIIAAWRASLKARNLLELGYILELLKRVQDEPGYKAESILFYF